MKTQLQSTFFGLLISTGAFAQNVNIPDANFKAYLVGESTINTNGDAEIQVSEATAFTGQINCSDLFIADMTGIEAFTSLYELVCFNNSINSLDVSTCASLTYLSCGNNNLTSLDLSNLSSLQYLGCWNNNLSSLDISNNTLLTSLQCQDNDLEQIDISQNSALTYFSCSSNNLSSLNMKNNSTSTLTSFYATSNPNLTCIEVDNVADATANWTNIDATASYSLSCSSAALEETDLESRISVYPNPAQSLIQINTGSVIKSVMIINALGSAYQVNLPSVNTIDVSNLPQGVYVLQIDTNEGLATKKFIKN